MGRSEKKSRPSSPPTSSVKDRSKLVYSTLGIGLVSFIVSYCLMKGRVTEDSAGIVIKLSDEDIEQSWVEDLHAYILNNIDTPTNKWDNKTYTKTIGHCHATCNNSSNNVDIFYDSNCRTHPVFVYDRIVTPELRSKMTYAEATIPCFLKLAESRIPNAHRGIFTTKYKIPKGLVFGPYYGDIKSAYGDEGQEARDGGYAWRVRPNQASMKLFAASILGLNFWDGVNRWDEEDNDFYIDGVDENNSNWLRYVNSARYEEEQNIFALLFNDTVYYITVKDIEPDTELLVWYGYKYAKWLRIFVIPSSEHDWDRDWAPPVNETICPSCPVTEGERRIEYDDEEENESNAIEEEAEAEEQSRRNNEDSDYFEGTINDYDLELDQKPLDNSNNPDIPAPKKGNGPVVSDDAPVPKEPKSS